MKLTKRQRELLDWVEGFVREKGFSPTLEEIADGLELKSISTVHGHLQRLKDKGAIQFFPNKRRSVETASQAAEGEVCNLPVYRDLSGEEDRRVSFSKYFRLDVPTDMLAGYDEERVYAVQVDGDWFRDEFIMHGDFLILEQRSDAEEMETVVARIAEEEGYVVKVFYLEEDEEQVRLESANREMLPVIYPAEAVEIVAVVVGVLRKFG